MILEIAEFSRAVAGFGLSFRRCGTVVLLPAGGARLECRPPHTGAKAAPPEGFLESVEG